MLRAFGYRSLGWGMGRNFGPSDAIQDLPDIVKNMSEEAGCKVSLIGWSLGGIYAREIARVVPDAVRRVITLGSSFNLTTRDQVAFARHYRSYELQKTGKYQLGPYNMTAEPLPVPSTAIYTRDDGFVPWQTTVQKPNERNENVEVRGSHLGLGVNPAVLYAICDRLAQAEGAFSPFEPPLLCRLWYPQRPVTAADFDVEKRS